MHFNLQHISTTADQRSIHSLLWAVKKHGKCDTNLVMSGLKSVSRFIYVLTHFIDVLWALS